MKVKKIKIALIAFGISSFSIYAQKKAVADSVKVKDGDRNVMLNAANNTGPREVNVGLPATVGGTTIMENGLPVVYFFWPEMPTKAWRRDAMITKSKLFDLGQTAMNSGEVGFSMSTFDNLGTDKLAVKGTLNSNQFGLLRGDINISGPIGTKGTKYSVGAYRSLDPGTFRAPGIDRYYSDNSQFYKAAITQDYKSSLLKGKISLFYKYANVEGIRNFYSPFIYDKDGKVSKIEGFDIGRDSYMETNQKIMLLNAFSGKYEQRDILKDYGAESHTVDLISNNVLSNGLKLDFTLRFRKSKSGQYTNNMTGVNKIDRTTDRYFYADNLSEEYLGKYAQGALILASRKTPMTTLMSTLNIGKVSGNHDWNIGLNQWSFNTDKFQTESAQYYQEVKSSPRKLVRKTLDSSGNWVSTANEYGNFASNGGLEYYDGMESKTSLHFLDKWKINRSFTLNVGAKITLNQLNGNYQPKKANVTNLNQGKKSINHKWWLKAFMLSGTYKVTNKFGVLGDFVYNEEGGHLNKYSTGIDPDLKVSKTPSASVGVYFNHPMLSLVSKVTYINKDEYRTAVNFSNPNDAGEVQRAISKYAIETLGWTTDIIANPFKNFELHFLVTMQSPRYKDFTGDVSFNDGTTSKYDFSDKTVTGVPKFLMEIDPSYKYKDLKVWASARYFSKQYFNKPNTLYMAGRWETFAGANYQFTKNLGVNVTFVNLLNQTGASGSLPEADLITTKEAADAKIGSVMSGTYIRPFSVEFGLKYQF